MNFWPNLLGQGASILPKIPGSVSGSGYGSWFDENSTSLAVFGFWVLG